MVEDRAHDDDEVLKKRIVLAVLDFLHQELETSTEDAREALEVSSQCLSVAFGIDCGNRQELNVQPGLIKKMFSSLYIDDFDGIHKSVDVPGADEKPEHEKLSSPNSGTSVGEVIDAQAAVVKGKDNEGGVSKNNKGGVSVEGMCRLEAGQGHIVDGSGGKNEVQEFVGGDKVEEGKTIDVEKKRQEFFTGLRGANFFAGTVPGSPEYSQREDQASKIFMDCIRASSSFGGEKEKNMSNLCVQTRRSSVAQDGVDINLLDEKRSACGAGEEKRDGKGDEEGRSETHHLKENLFVPNRPSSFQEIEDSREADGFKLLGNSCMSEGKFEEAAEYYTIALGMDPRNPIFHANRAAAYQHLGRFQEALLDSEVAIGLDPNYAKAYSRLGHAYMGLGKFQEAIELGFEKALLLDPSSTILKDNLKVAKRKLEVAQRKTDNNKETRDSTQQQAVLQIPADVAQYALNANILTPQGLQQLNHALFASGGGTFIQQTEPQPSSPYVLQSQIPSSVNMTWQGPQVPLNFPIPSGEFNNEHMQHFVVDPMRFGSTIVDSLQGVTSGLWTDMSNQTPQQ